MPCGCFAGFGERLAFRKCLQLIDRDYKIFVRQISQQHSSVRQQLSTPLVLFLGALKELPHWHFQRRAEPVECLEARQIDAALIPG